VHRSQNTLTTIIESAAQKVTIGGAYRHYKNQKNTYKIIHIGIMEWNDEVCIIYQADYGERLVFVRPVNSWLDDVEWQGKIVPRFELIKNN
jgi:hypothetical protein